MSVTGEFKSELPLDMFSNTVTQIYSRANDRSSQLVMWNTLFRGFRANAQEQAIFISIGMKFPYQSFHEYLGDISFSKNTNLVKMELRKRLEKNVFIRELNDLAAMEAYLIWWEEMTFNKEGVSKPHTTIVVQDFAIALNLKKHINYTKSSRILLRLRKLCKRNGITIILFENDVSALKYLETFFDQFLDYKIAISSDNSNLQYKVTDFGHNFLGYPTSLNASGLMKGEPVEINHLFSLS